LSSVDVVDVDTALLKIKRTFLSICALICVVFVCFHVSIPEGMGVVVLTLDFKAQLSPLGYGSTPTVSPYIIGQSSTFTKKGDSYPSGKSQALKSEFKNTTCIYFGIDALQHEIESMTNDSEYHTSVKAGTEEYQLARAYLRLEGGDEVNEVAIASVEVACVSTTRHGWYILRKKIGCFPVGTVIGDEECGMDEDWVKALGWTSKYAP
jgi:hypothetical protein